MTEERVDLSVLDPARDPLRWDRLVESVASGAWTARQRRLTVTHQLVTWARPALLAAAAAALIPWAATLASKSGSERDTMTQSDPVFVLAQWAQSDERPSATRILQVLGERHDIE